MHRSLPGGRAHDGPSVTYDTDVLVIGAGPAGAVAAWEAKRAAPELNVVLLERDAAVGTPVRCAEAAGMARGSDGRWHVRVRGPGGGGGDTCRARVVIGADGVEAMVGRWAGLDTRV